MRSQIGLLRLHAFVVVAKGAAQARYRRTVHDIQMRLPELPTEDHDLLHSLVLVDEVRFREMSERLVTEDTGQDGIQNHRERPGFNVGRREQLNCSLAEMARCLP